MCLLWIFPEVIHLAVGVGAKAGAVGESEVVFQDGSNEAGKARVSGKGCEVETVLAIAVGIIEADAFRRVAEPIGLFLGVKVDDCVVLVHCSHFLPKFPVYTIRIRGDTGNRAEKRRAIVSPSAS